MRLNDNYYEFTLEFAQGKLIPSVKTPSVGPTTTPAIENAAWKEK